VQRHEKESGFRSDFLARLARASNFGGPGKKHEDVALQPLSHQPAHRGGDLRAERPFVGGRKVLDGYVKEAALGEQDWGREIRGQRVGRERRAHNDHAQLGPVGSTQALDQCQGNVALQMPFVKFVENDGSDAG